MNGLLKPNSGYVEVLDRPLTEHKNINEVRRHVALTFQQVNDQLFCSSVWEEIAFCPRNLGWSKQRVRETVEKWLAYFELDEVSHRSPHHLSGGQKRSVALAAAMAMEPQLLILDEPGKRSGSPESASLDCVSSRLADGHNGGFPRFIFDFRSDRTLCSYGQR